MSTVKNDFEMKSLAPAPGSFLNTKVNDAEEPISTTPRFTTNPTGRPTVLKSNGPQKIGLMANPAPLSGFGTGITGGAGPVTAYGLYLPVSPEPGPTS